MPGPDDSIEEPESQRDAESVAALDRGGLPVTATRRLAEAEAAGGTWSSDLSVAELAAVRSVGFDPVGLVLGSCVYHVAAQWGPTWAASVSGRRGIYSASFPCPHGYHNEMRVGYNWEHSIYEEGVVKARDLAMSRMLAEAQALGAHGVVGVRLTFSRPGGSAGTLDFNAVGTAIRRAGAPPVPYPFTCHLSGQDFAKLMRIGFVPAALVLGVAAVEVDPGCGMEWQERSYANQEFEQETTAVQACREIAVAHLEREASAVGRGVVGVEVEMTEHSVGSGSLLFELQATGTAVRRFSDVPLPEPPLAIMRLGGGT